MVKHYLLQHYLESYLHSCLIRALNLQNNIPWARHRKCLILAKGSDIGSFASLYRCARRAHVHKLHVDADLYLCIGNRIAAAIIQRNNDGVSIINTRGADLQTDTQIAGLFCLSIRGGRCRACA